MKTLTLGMTSLLFLLSCTSLVNKNQLTGSTQYVNYKDGKFTNSKPMWKSAHPQKDKVTVHVVSQPTTFTASCFTLMVGINPSGDTEEIAVSHLYGDKQQLFTAVKRYRSQKWQPTQHNPNKLAAVVKVETYSFSDVEETPAAYKENCSNYLK